MADQIKTWQERAAAQDPYATLPKDNFYFLEQEVSELRAAIKAQQGLALDAARYRWLIGRAFDIEFISDSTTIATSYSYFGSGEVFAKWVTEQIDAALAARREG